MLDYTLERILRTKERVPLVGETEMRKEAKKKVSENKKKSIREIRIDGSEKKKNIYIYTYIIRRKEKIRRKEGSGIKNKIPPTIAYISFPRAIGISRSCTHRYSKSWFTIESRDLESKEEEEEDS